MKSKSTEGKSSREAALSLVFYIQGDQILIIKQASISDLSFIIPHCIELNGLSEHNVIFATRLLLHQGPLVADWIIGGQG